MEKTCSICGKTSNLDSLIKVGVEYFHRGCLEQKLLFLNLVPNNDSAVTQPPKMKTPKITKPPPVMEGKEYVVTIDGVTRNGEGKAKIKGFTILVPCTRVGSQVKVKITEVKPNFASAEVKTQTMPKNMKIRELKPGMKGVNVKARVIEISEPRQVVTRFGNICQVASAILGDETGTMKWTLWNQQVQAVSVGEVVQIEDAQVTKFRNEAQLSVGKRGRINTIKSTHFPSIEKLKKKLG
jgi:predicted RNA-binding protein with TRAM domain